MKGELAGGESQLIEMVKQHPDATLSQYCEYWRETHQQWMSSSTMCRALQKAELTRKKRRSARSTQAATERVQKLPSDEWEQVSQIAPENLVFLDEMGVLLGLTRTHEEQPTRHKSLRSQAVLSRRKSHCHRCDQSQASISRHDLEWFNGWQCF